MSTSFYLQVAIYFQEKENDLFNKHATNLSMVKTEVLIQILPQQQLNR